jgi:hypothetical protein
MMLPINPPAMREGIDWRSSKLVIMGSMRMSP